ncbi:ZBTB46 [Branchiostoma lanceolatum]|uniref:ZBTB46 protein n=1 Tax=Branchiostoma lanceolatum TaxID=7740 RepID=A0A8J9ZCX1_BRALA|nr:ZBTB46 [Branchiostoma lanceolatum]
MAAKDEIGLFSPQNSSDFSVSAVSADHEFLSSPEESPRRGWDTGDTCYGSSVYQDIHYDNKNTQRAMRSAVVTFRDFLIDSGLNPTFEDMPPEKLDAVLTLFFSNARKRNRELYKWSTFSGIRYGIYRHLLSRVPSVDIMHSRDFAGSQQAFNEKLKMIKESGKGEINHTPMMTPEDTERLYKSGVMSTDNPQGLQRKVFFELLYFLLKQKRGHVLRDLMKDDVRFAVNQDGKWYAYLMKNDCGQGTSLEEHEKVYEIPGCPLCPIQSLLKYKSKLHPSCDFLFQQPKKLPLAEDIGTAAPFADDPVWYNDKPTGKNALSHMMSAISEDAGLSQMYSNSSIRSCAELIDGQLTLQLPVLLKKISSASHKLQGQSGGSNSSLSQTFTASVPTTSYTVPDPQMFQPQSLQQTFNPGPSLSEINQDSAVSQRLFPSQSSSHSYNTVPKTQSSFHMNSFVMEGNSSFNSETSSSREANFPSRYQRSSSASKSSTSPRSTPPSRLNQGGATVNYHCSSDNFVQQETVQSSFVQHLWNSLFPSNVPRQSLPIGK